MATLEEITKASEAIRDATEVGENTATRVGGVFCDMAELIGSVMNDVQGLKTETLAVLDITNDYTALDFDLSTDKDNIENAKTYLAIKEGIYLLKKTTSNASETDNYMIVGVMFVFKDGMMHCLQELIFTNELIEDSSTGHVDNYMMSKFRAWQNYNSPHTPKNAWGKWQDYVSTLFEQELIKGNVIQGNTLVDGSVSGKKLIDNTISTTKLQDGVVTAQKIEDETIPLNKLSKDVQAAISKSTTSATAKDVSYDNASSGVSSINIQDAIDDIYNKIGNVNDVIEKLLGI